MHVHYYKSVGRNKPKEKLGSCVSLEKAKSIIKAAKSLCDDRLSSKILSVDLIAKKAKYHHSCCRSYLIRAERTVRTCLNEKSKAHEEAFNILKGHIEETLVSAAGAELLASLHSQYMSYLKIEASMYSA